jgi:hypothetical protein
MALLLRPRRRQHQVSGGPPGRTVSGSISGGFLACCPRCGTRRQAADLSLSEHEVCPVGLIVWFGADRVRLLDEFKLR